MSVHYHKYENQTLSDKRLKGTTRDLYDFMLSLSHLHEHDLVISITELAEGIQRTYETTRVHLNKLIRLGLIERILRKDSTRKKWNLKSRYIVHDVVSEPKPDSLEYFDQWRSPQKIWGGPQKNPGGKDFKKEVREDINNTLKRESDPPLKEHSTKNETVTQATKTKEPDKEENLIKVPEIMRSTARYLLLRTSRKALSQKDIEALKFLAENHMPARVQKQIDICIERNNRLGKSLNSLNFSYIAACLGNQNSLKKKPSKNVSGDKATKQNPTQGSTNKGIVKIKERNLPLEEAEAAISEYTPSVTSESFPTALEELHKKIHEANEELAEQYFDAKYPKDEDGCYILPEDDDSEDELPGITLEDYLRLKYPEADKEVLSIDRVRDQKGLQEAFEMDKTCAYCSGQSGCPFNKKRGRPVVMMKYGRLEIGYTINTPCKHDMNKPNPELKNRIKKSGLSEIQAKQTFAAYDHSNAETAIAKAKAILAAKNKSSLILAGKPGTGKTHLAVAIAIDAMQSGRQATFRTMPDLLEELRRADWEHTDFFGLKRMFGEVDCLVLDDWGKEKATDKGMEYLYQIIDYRYRHGKQTIVTTNALNPAELGDASKIEALVSRLMENGEWVSLKETDNYRLKVEPKVMTEPEIPTDTEVIPEPVAVAEDEAVTEAETKAEPEVAVEATVTTESVPDSEPDATAGEEAQDDDGCRSILSILCGKKTVKKPTPEICPNDNNALAAEAATETPKASIRSIYEDEEFWKEDEDEYRLYGDTGIPGRDYDESLESDDEEPPCGDTW